jgi:hypothetical protein
MLGSINWPLTSNLNSRITYICHLHILHLCPNIYTLFCSVCVLEKSLVEYKHVTSRRTTTLRRRSKISNIKFTWTRSDWRRISSKTIKRLKFNRYTRIKKASNFRIYIPAETRTLFSYACSIDKNTTVNTHAFWYFFVAKCFVPKGSYF